MSEQFQCRSRPSAILNIIYFDKMIGSRRSCFVVIAISLMLSLLQGQLVRKSLQEQTIFIPNDQNVAVQTDSSTNAQQIIGQVIPGPTAEASLMKINDIQSDQIPSKKQKPQERQIQIIREEQPQGNERLTWSYNRAKLQRGILLTEQINGKVFHVNKSPLNKYFINDIAYTDLTNEDKHYEQFIIRATNQQHRLLIKNQILRQKNYYKEWFRTNFYSFFQELKKNITLSTVKFDGYPSPNNLASNSNKPTFQYLPFCVVVPSFHTIRSAFYKRNINSILQQQYSNYHVVYIDDKSEEEVVQNVIDYIKGIYNESYELKSDTSQNIGQPNQTTVDWSFNNIKWTFVKNSQRKYDLQTIYEAVHQHCADDQIAVIVDGDDALVGTQTLATLNYMYRLSKDLFIYSSYLYKSKLHLNESITMPQQWSKIRTMLQTGGNVATQFVRDSTRFLSTYQVSNITLYEKGPAGMLPPTISIREKTFRSSQTLIASHLLTFYVPLFKKIHISNFLDENNLFFKYASDRALTLPLAELAVMKTVWIDDYLYEFNANTSTMESPSSWAEESLKIRQRAPLQGLEDGQIDLMRKKVLKS